MKRVIGIGGIFFQARDPARLRAWYARHLGIDVQPWGGAALEQSGGTCGSTAWSIGAVGSDQFAPGTAPFMINYRVHDLAALLQALRAEGCNVLDKSDDGPYGKFGWVVDPEGNKIELWEPPDAADEQDVVDGHAAAAASAGTDAHPVGAAPAQANA